MNNKDFRSIMEAYQGVCKESTDERNFEIAKSYIMDFIHKNLKGAAFNENHFDYNYLNDDETDEDFHSNQEENLVIMMPSIYFAYDVDIDPDMDAESQVREVNQKIEDLVIKMNMGQFLEYTVEHVQDRSIHDLENLHASRNEWIGINVHTDNDMSLKLQSIPYYLNLLKEFNDKMQAMASPL